MGFEPIRPGCVWVGHAAFLELSSALRCPLTLLQKAQRREEGRQVTIFTPFPKRLTANLALRGWKNRTAITWSFIVTTGNLVTVHLKKINDKSRFFVFAGILALVLKLRFSRINGM